MGQCKLSECRSHGRDCTIFSVSGCNKSLSSGLFFSFSGKSHALKPITALFCEQGSLKLSRFLKAQYAKSIYFLAKKKDKEDSLGYGSVPIATAGITPPWILTGPCHKQRFLELSTENLSALKPESLESKLAELHNHLSSDPFEKFITALISEAEKV